jgi:ADP-ribose pyrophosphatase
MTDDGHLIETRIDGETPFEGRLLRLEVDRVRLPNGGESVRELIRHPGAAVMVPVLPDGRLIFVRQYRYPTGEVLLELPAGKLEWGEDPLQCARRETAEETGYRPGTVSSLGAFYTAPGFSDEIIHAYLVTDLEPDPDATTDGDENLDVVILERSEVGRLLAGGDLRDAKTIAALALWQARLAEGGAG